VRGAAIATIISQAVSKGWVLLYFLGGRSQLKLRAANLRLRRSIVLPILAIGSAPFAMQLAASLLNALLTRQLQRYGGDLAISAMGIVFSVAMLTLMPIFGLNGGSQPLIGYNYGARRYDRVKQTLRLAIAAATGFVLVGFAVIQIFPAGILRLFNRDDPQLLELGVTALRTFTVMLPVVGFQIVAASYFQAVGKPRPAMLLSLSRQVLLLIPAILLLPRWLGLRGIFVAGPLSDLGSALLTALWLGLEVRRLGRGPAAAGAAPASGPRGPGKTPPGA